MASYGRNFDFRVPPVGGKERRGRFYLDEGTDIPIGAPVVAKTPAEVSTKWSGAQAVELATGAQAPSPAQSGIAVYEHIDYNGFDPSYTTYSDLDTVPDGRLVQVVSGAGLKVVFTNTEDRTHVNRQYDGRVMVAGLGATPTVAVGDYLTPGTGDDSSGYWAETANANEAWLVVTAVNADRGEVEAELLF